MKTGILALAYKRHFIFDIWAKEVVKLGVPVYVVNDEPDIQKMCEDNGITFLNHPNTNLTDKWNYGLSFMKSFDYVMILGDDDIPSFNLLSAYQPAIDNKTDYIGFLDMYIHDLFKNKTYYWSGYSNFRKGETIGSGRMFSKRLLTLLDYKFCDKKVKCNFDGNLSEKLKGLEYTRAVITMNNFDKYIYSIHSYVNITNIDNFTELHEVDNFKNYNFVDDAELLIVMPCYNSEELLEQTVDSIFNQSFKNIRLSLIDDASTDGTSDVINMLLMKYKGRIKAFKNTDNIGCYRSVNKVLYNESFCNDWKYFFLSGSDDYHYFERFEKQINLISNDIVACGCGWKKVNYKTKEIQYIKQSGASSYVYKRDVFDKIGYYDSVRIGGDSEFNDRCICYFGRNKLENISYCMETSWDTGTGLTSIDKGDSANRLMYVKTYQLDHKLGKLKRYYIDSPIVVTMATMQGREDSCKSVVDTLLKQVDKIYVWCNPQSEFVYDNQRVIIKRGHELGDTGKFVFDNELKDCWRLSCDDDIDYPFDYISRAINNAIHYDCVISFHGRIFDTTKMINNYYHDAKLTIPCLCNYEADQQIHIPGSGVMCNYINKFRIDYRLITDNNMGDVWAGYFANQEKIKIMEIGHYAGWIKDLENYDQDITIFNKLNNNCSKQTELINTMIFNYNEISINNKIKKDYSEMKTLTIRRLKDTINSRVGDIEDMAESTALSLAMKGLIEIIQEPNIVTIMFNKQYEYNGSKFFAGNLLEVSRAKAFKAEKEGYAKIIDNKEIKEEKVKIETKEEKVKIETKEEKIVNNITTKTQNISDIASKKKRGRKSKK